MQKVFITDYIDNSDIEINILNKHLSSTMDQNVRVVLVWHKKIDKTFIDKYPNLIGIVRYGVGYDNIDVKYANSKGIVVCNTPDYGTDEVSDSALAMLLSISRGIILYDNNCRNYKNSWQENTINDLKRISEYKLGVIGAGRIGGSLLIKAKSIGFQTFFFDPYKPIGHDKVTGAKRFDHLDKLLSFCDIISIHTPLTQETNGIVDELFISKMKKGSSFINTARGKIVKNIDVFYKPLKTNYLNFLALDVLPEEPPKSSILINAWKDREEWLNGRLIINPHTAYYSIQSFIDMRAKAADNALRIIKGEKPYNIVSK